MMLPVNGEDVTGADGLPVPGGVAGQGDCYGDGSYDGRDGRTVRVKPTTLLFSSAPRAVAGSHEVANNFSWGTSDEEPQKEGRRLVPREAHVQDRGAGGAGGGAAAVLDKVLDGSEIQLRGDAAC